MSNINYSQKITPFLWFDQQAEEAVNFYISVFPNSELRFIKKWPETTPFPSESTKPGTVQQAIFQLDGLQFYAFDAGPMFRFNPSISFFSVFETKEEIDKAWNSLVEGGEVLMPLDSYEWSERYGWLTDRFGVSWQLMKGTRPKGSGISPLLMFSGKQCGNAEEAMKLYTSLFEDSSVSENISRYSKNEGAPAGLIKHAQFSLTGQSFMVMDNATGNEMPFNEAISFYVDCQDQQEVDFFWNKFTEEGKESVCGWLKDKFGVSWQIVPRFLTEKITEDDEKKVLNLMEAMNQMTKLEVAKLKEAYEK